MQAQQLQQAVTPTEKFLKSQSAILSHRTLTLSLGKKSYKEARSKTQAVRYSAISVTNRVAGQKFSSRQDKDFFKNHINLSFEYISL